MGKLKSVPMGLPRTLPPSRRSWSGRGREGGSIFLPLALEHLGGGSGAAGVAPDLPRNGFFLFLTFFRKGFKLKIHHSQFSMSRSLGLLRSMWSGKRSFRPPRGNFFFLSSPFPLTSKRKAAQSPPSTFAFLGFLRTTRTLPGRFHATLVHKTFPRHLQLKSLQPCSSATYSHVYFFFLMCLNVLLAQLQGSRGSWKGPTLLHRQ